MLTAIMETAKGALQYKLGHGFWNHTADFIFTGSLSQNFP